MTSTRLFTTIDALVALLGPALSGSAQVIDGPPQDWNSLPGSALLLIGTQPSSDESGSSQIDWAALGAKTYDEELQIICTVYTTSGVNKVKTQRDLAASILSTVQEKLRTDPSIGGAVLYSRLEGVSQFSQSWYEQGTRCTLVFTIAARAYLEAV